MTSLDKIREQIGELGIGTQFFLTISGQDPEEVMFRGVTEDGNSIKIGKTQQPIIFPIAHIENIEYSW